jgi:hypothetical protein
LIWTSINVEIIHVMYLQCFLLFVMVLCIVDFRRYYMYCWLLISVGGAVENL